MNDYKELFGLLAVAMSVYGYSFYIRDVLRGTTKPHVFSWIIWSLISVIVFLAQIADNAGPGAWPAGMTTLLSVLIVVLAFRQGEKNITRGDKVSFAFSLLAIPLWRITNDPMWSVITVTLINAVSYYPTVRKSWHKPHQETSRTYGLNALRHGITILAIANVTVTTVLYPVALVFINGGMWLLLIVRRQLLTKENKK